MEYEIWRNINTETLHVVGMIYRREGTTAVETGHVVRASGPLTIHQLRAAEHGRFTNDATLAAYIDQHKDEYETLPPYDAIMGGVIVVG